MSWIIDAKVSIFSMIGSSRLYVCSTCFPIGSAAPIALRKRFLRCLMEDNEVSASWTAAARSTTSSLDGMEGAVLCCSVNGQLQNSGEHRSGVLSTSFECR